jgi:hypothetical protein
VANAFEVRDEMEEAVESPLRKVQAAMTGRPRVLDRVAFNATASGCVTSFSLACASRRAGRSTQPGCAKTPGTGVGALRYLSARCSWPERLIIPT